MELHAERDYSQYWPTHIGSKRITLRTWETCWEQKMLTPTTLPKSTQNWFPLGACWLTSLLIRCQGFLCGERVIGFVDFYFSFIITTIKSNFHLKCVKPGTFFKFVTSKKIQNFQKSMDFFFLNFTGKKN